MAIAKNFNIYTTNQESAAAIAYNLVVNTLSVKNADVKNDGKEIFVAVELSQPAYGATEQAVINTMGWFVEMKAGSNHYENVTRIVIA